MEDLMLRGKLKKQVSESRYEAITGAHFWGILLICF